MSEELKPCPFCGSDAINLIGNDDARFWWVECAGCCVETQGKETQADAAAEWNRRSPTPEEQHSPVEREGEK